MMMNERASLVLLFLGLISLRLAHAEILFSETFEEDVFASKESGSPRWLKSQDEKYAGQEVQVRSPASAASLPAGFEGDKGVQLAIENRFYCFGAEFASPIAPLKSGSELVVQYELRFEETLGCGGAYIKMPRQTEGFSVSSMNNESPYAVMFGPDKCGSSNKIHFIIQHLSPVTGLWEEKHFNETVPFPVDKRSHLYTLQLRPDSSFAIYVDEEEAGAGSLLTHMSPPVNPPAEVDDPSDHKPASWEDRETIPDPDARKPEDWDEEQPPMIVDETAVKPAAWDESAPAAIPDPDAVKPEDWDGEEDGEWEAPSVANPQCRAGGGCGKWTPPQIRNPKYRGQWVPPLVANPAYKGEWSARKIANPAYFYDAQPAASLPAIAALAVEVWTTTAGIHFDNFLVATSLKDAFDFAGKTFVPKSKAEKEREAAEERERKAAAASEKKAAGDGGMLSYLQEQYLEIRTFVLTAPPRSLAMILGLPVIGLLSLLYLICTTPTQRRRPAPRPTPSTTTAVETETEDIDADDAAEEEEEEEEVPVVPASKKPATRAKRTTAAK